MTMASTTSSAAPSAGPTLGLDSLFSAKGLVVLITGGGTGIGRNMARALAEAGAKKVYIVGRRPAALQEAAAAIEAPLGRSGVVVPVEGDVTSKASLAAVARHVEADAGYLNVVLCNAGVNGPQTPTPADNDETATLEQWRNQQLAVDFDAYTDTFKVNTSAVWFTAVTFLQLLDAGNRLAEDVEQTSQVIVTTSVAAFNRKAPGGWAYGQSKAAATHAAKQLATLLPRWGIRVNCISPGYFPSEMTTGLMDSLGASPGQTFIPIAKSQVPVGRIGDERDMAGTVLYAVSRAGAYLNGTVLLVDGGRLGTFPATY
ncbi:NAD(P)-binding domain protein [Niveomyces insectorum RCEF 264]|uniref:NAD(P)-binding domain protein n=1 Tax=Niveomyces insectorum RCEF 264 TaxID=1081102 RepID=A0A167ZXH5_9HYPO|nr:NAD(P)-binding domain protein [Niveomyces insectorum RCEF 264]